VLLVTPNAFLNAAFLNFPAPANRDPARLRHRRSGERPESLRQQSVRSIFSPSPMATTCTPFVVTGTRAASPAEKQGFVKGDIISGLDDKPATAFTLGQLRDTFGAQVRPMMSRSLRAGKQTSIAIAIAVVSIDRRHL
jgi:hypothetical protein